MKHKILIADDESEIRNLLKLYLSDGNYEVIEACDGDEAIKALDLSPDICVLDIMMPGKDGYAVLSEIRKRSNIPVIILSAKDADSEKILGLNLGADDYIAKPFNPLEAVARINSCIRRFYSIGGAAPETHEEIKIRDLTLDLDGCSLKRGEEDIELTSIEFKIMELLMTHPGKVFTKQQIYEYAWGDDYIVADNNIMVCISKLRTKLSPDQSMYIKTLRGLGYRFESQ